MGTQRRQVEAILAGARAEHRALLAHASSAHERAAVRLAEHLDAA